MVLCTNKVIGHRGAAAYAPENTIASFDKALSLGAQAIEFDVMCSADGEPFIIHDDSLKRTTNGKGQVGLVEANYLHELDAGSWFSKAYKGEPLPHFKDALKWLSFPEFKLILKLNPTPAPQSKPQLRFLVTSIVIGPKQRLSSGFQL